MPVIKTRTFFRIVEAGNLEAAIIVVDAEVNTFLASFVNMTNVRGIDYHTGLASKYGERLLYKATVVYLE